MIRKILFIIILLSLSVNSFAQREVTTSLKDSTRRHSPAIATIASAVIPGLGQIYNQKYWKVPIIYGTFGTLWYLFNYHNNQYAKFKEALANYGSPGPYYYYDQTKSKVELEWYKEQHQRLREIMVISMIGAYVLTIMDASVDAFLYDYDVSDNLAFRIEPTIIQPFAYKPLSPTVGLQFRIKF